MRSPQTHIEHFAGVTGTKTGLGHDSEQEELVFQPGALKHAIKKGVDCPYAFLIYSAGYMFDFFKGNQMTLFLLACPKGKRCLRYPKWACVHCQSVQPRRLFQGEDADRDEIGLGVGRFEGFSLCPFLPVVETRHRTRLQTWRMCRQVNSPKSEGRPSEQEIYKSTGFWVPT